MVRADPDIGLIPKTRARMKNMAKVVSKPKENHNLETVLGRGRKQENRAQRARMSEIAKIWSKPKRKCNLELVLGGAREKRKTALRGRMSEIAKV